MTEQELKALKQDAELAADTVVYAYAGRGYGHTTLMMEGAKNVKGALVIAAHEQHARQLRQQYPGVNVISVIKTDQLFGMRAPVAIDHFAIDIAMRKQRRYIEALERKLNTRAERKEDHEQR